MNWEAAYQAYLNQRANASKKRLPFAITFKEWCDAWGDRIDQRGPLQMQRIDKTVGYVAGNLQIGERPKRRANSTRIDA